MKCRHTYLFAGLCALLFGACTGNFRDINDDLSGITDGELEADNNGLGYRLGIIQQGVYFNYDFGKGKNWPFQLTQNLNADMFSGYMHDPKPLQGGSHNSDYNLQDGWNSAMWQFTYSYVMPEIYRLEQTAAELMPPFYAIAKILKVLAMQRVTDYYGPVIYTRFGAQGAEYVPDGQREVYMRFFDDLDQASEILSDYVAERPTARRTRRRAFPISTCCSTAAMPHGSASPTPCACVWPCVLRQSRRRRPARSSGRRPPTHTG